MPLINSIEASSSALHRVLNLLARLIGGDVVLAAAGTTPEPLLQSAEFQRQRLEFVGTLPSGENIGRGGNKLLELLGGVRRAFGDREIERWAELHPRFAKRRRAHGGRRRFCGRGGGGIILAIQRFLNVHQRLRRSAAVDVVDSIEVAL